MLKDEDKYEENLQKEAKIKFVSGGLSGPTGKKQVGEGKNKK